jgi:hypothetical protein
MDIQLETGYVLWYHSVTEKSWEKDSYINLCQDLPDKTIRSVKQLWGVYKTLKNNFTAGMFFLMREGVLPIWEDEKNKNGGYWSYKVPKKQSNDIWLKLSAALVGNTLTDDMLTITGISVSPKITNCVMKIWNSDSSICKTDIFTKEIDYLDKETLRYNKHQR